MRPSGRRWLVRTSEADGRRRRLQRAHQRQRHLGERPDGLRLAALDDLEVRGGQAGHDAAVLVGHDHVDDDLIDGGAQHRRRRLRRLLRADAREQDEPGGGDDGGALHARPHGLGATVNGTSRATGPARPAACASTRNR